MANLVTLTVDENPITPARLEVLVLFGPPEAERLEHANIGDVHVDLGQLLRRSGQPSRHVMSAKRFAGLSVWLLPFGNRLAVK
jgi:hypothetical protein